MTGYDLLHNGTIAMHEAEHNGIAIDVEQLQDEKIHISRKLTDIEEFIWNKKIGQRWKSQFGNKSSLLSNQQLSYILFNVLGMNSDKKTKTGKNSTDKEALEEINHPLCRKVLEYRKWHKVLNTYLAQIEREINDDDIIRPNFDLHTTLSYRSSSSNPNFQNIPVRDPEIGRVIRSLFKARPGRRLIEGDYGSLEVRIGTCVHKDVNLIAYLNSGNCMHKDTAAELFCLKIKNVSKIVRFIAKSGFVFPAFYGSFYKNMAPRIWKMVEQLKPRTEDGFLLMNHLKSIGIDTVVKFTEHVRVIEEKFWSERFYGYDAWKKEFYQKYLKRGWFTVPTGFKYHGNFSKAQVTNIGIQGPAFHCLLWSFIHVLKEIKQRGMKSLLVGQIHDSIIADVPEDEYDEYKSMVTEISTTRLMSEWKWITTPLEVEIEASPVNGTWADKQPV